MFHDVQQTGDEFWSGELHCTLRALTPLIAGSFQSEYQHASQGVVEAFEELIEQRSGQIPVAVNEKKKIIEPMRLGEANGVPEHVVIPGEAIKGAIRQSWQALLSAPMERVQERTFSFRPNLRDAERIRPAIVHRCRYEGKRLIGIEVELSEDKVGRKCTCEDIIYVFKRAIPVLQEWIANNYDEKAEGGLERLPEKAPRADINAMVPGLEVTGRNYAKKLDLQQRRGMASADLYDYVLVRYLEGQDGTSTFRRAFDGKLGYQWALVKVNHTVDPEYVNTVCIPDHVVQNYADTLQHLADEQRGHLLQHPGKEKLTNVDKNIQRFQKEKLPRPGDLLYLEYDRAPDDPNARIIGIGHHFRYRRKYRDSVQQSNQPANTTADNLRKVLCPTELEQTFQRSPTYAGAPSSVSGARGLFGYVAQNRKKYDAEAANEPLTFGIAAERSDFKQLAGRIAINWAVEQPRKADKARFLNEEHAYLVPLRPLSAPKPSAVEMYLTQDRVDQRQDGGSLCTYGDSRDDPATGELRGRKFYLHQPDATNQPDCYELTGTEHPDWYIGDNMAKPAIISDQAALARFISAPGARFKFTIRFRDLHAWELGALFFVLTTDLTPIRQLLKMLKFRDGLPQRLSRWLERADQWEKQSPSAPLLAMKLGHGRPLGLGSVRIDIDSIARLRFGQNNEMVPVAEEHPEQAEVQGIQEDAIQAFATKLNENDPSGKRAALWIEKVLLPWLQVRRYAGRTRYDYPRGRDGKAAQGLIYEYHSQQRQIHARGRKLPEPEQPLVPGGLMSLDEFDDLDAQRP